MPDKILLENKKSLFKGNSSLMREWDFSFTLTVSSGAIGSDLEDFPLMVHLSNSSGIGSSDLTHIFTELGDNSRKMTIRTSEGVDLPVEVERWDSGSEEAFLWTKVPQISASEDTELTLFYDKDHVDNVDYIFSNTSVGASAVWTDSFDAVWHLNEADALPRLDSTDGNNTATTHSFTVNSDVDAKIGKGVDFDPAADYMTVGTESNFDYNVSDPFSGSAWIKVSDPGGTGAPSILGKFFASASTNGWEFYHNRNRDELGFSMRQTSTNLLVIDAVPGFDIADNQWHHVAFSKGTVYADTKVYVDGIDVTSLRINNGTITSILNNEDLYIGKRNNENSRIDGVFDEVRMHGAERSADYIAAEYYSGDDSLISFT